MRYLCVVVALVCGLLSQAFAGDFWQKAKAVFEGKKQQDGRGRIRDLWVNQL
ncbi:hypothetical protein [Cysteiniphilum litorale]|uniref:Uncharacterized protein n=1 Tax=Cysteiniphilum litorale TaxID=2056700 RepID=A0A8J2Z732_9GAMM|nr:hypothetical protein [Cysteiniphilum litorale]GGG08594.1 hypothetical protein GCM10010995_27680 [Cysteiniphilum litorale]